MIADKIGQLILYEQLKPYAQPIFDFIQRYRVQNLPQGRYDLLGDELFALVQKYETKELEQVKMESHQCYADIQYMEKGKELIYYHAADLLTVLKDHTPQSDIIFYEEKSWLGVNLLLPGIFCYYAPTDAHMPCVTYKQKESVEKIVFKVRL